MSPALREVIQQAKLLAAFKQALLFMLAMDLKQAGAELGQLAKAWRYGH